LNIESEINQLKERIKRKIGEEGFSNLINNLATQAIAVLQRNENSDLNSLDYAILKLMMIDYLFGNNRTTQLIFHFISLSQRDFIIY
jgi:hypothetical protein